MERGPVALFGAILAVGLGPALWLGAQLSVVDLAPSQRPAPVDEQFPGADMDFGGAGAGEMPDDDEPLSTYSYTPLTSSASPVAVRPSPVATHVSDTGRPVPPVPPPPSSPPVSSSPSASESPSPEPSTSDSATPSTEPSGSVSPSPST
ncbi:hypothetical protein SAMN05421541_11596 [Actinoplanes philippinensis]|uniref:Uncharacterized protein n=1 Tax=Actinoplanes philippinensis TaxID=35752 RepID=A0A1I2K4P7_9ACTN|nr:hypothetical protein SAMN05421541_11596 [Actinoplanes philippinensis]